MLSSFFALKKVLCLGLVVVVSTVVSAQVGFVPDGGEYNIAGSLAGDQVMPSIGINPSGGYIVWEDNVTDGSGKGISARRLDSSLTGSLSVFRVNVQGGADQQNPKVAMVNGGGAAFVWQGGSQIAQQIYARFLSSSNTWLTGDVLVNSAYTNSPHLNPSVATLAGGNIVVVWSCFDRDGSLQGVYGQRFSPAGAKLGGDFRINVATNFNQRNPSVVALSDGNFVVTWVSETQLSQTAYDVSVYARRFDANGGALGGEFKVNTGMNICNNPSVAASPAGGFIVTWDEKDTAVAQNSLDIHARVFANNGTGGAVKRLNTYQYGDQYVPKAAALSSRYLVVWTSLGQDGSWEGVFGQFLHDNGSFVGGEFRVNTTVVSRQMDPAVAADGADRFLVAWGSFTGVANGFDLFAQRYLNQDEALSAPGAPFVTVLSSNMLSLTWPEVGGYNVAHYEIYANGSVSPTVTVTSNWWTMTGLAPASTHYFRLAYVLTDGRRSPISDAATNTTFSALWHFNVLPQEWMNLYWGATYWTWPPPDDDSDDDGVSNRNEFLAGTNPTDADSVLRTRLEASSQGLFLHWNTEPGLMYQVQASINMGAWSNVGGPRFAPGHVDSLNVGNGSGGYYRIVRLR